MPTGVPYRRRLQGECKEAHKVSMSRQPLPPRPTLDPPMSCQNHLYMGRAVNSSRRNSWAAWFTDGSSEKKGQYHLESCCPKTGKWQDWLRKRTNQLSGLDCMLFLAVNEEFNTIKVSMFRYLLTHTVASRLVMWSDQWSRENWTIEEHPCGAEPYRNQPGNLRGT